MSSLAGDGWSPEDHDGWQDAPRPESTQVDRERAAETAAAVRTESRAAYLGGVPNRHHPDL